MSIVDTASSGRRMLKGVLDRIQDRDSESASGRHAIFAFAVRVTSAGLAYTSQLVLARWMGVEEYGIYAYCWVWLTILGVVASAGLNTSVMRFVTEYVRDGQPGHLRGLLRGSRGATLAISTLIALLGALVVHVTDGVVDEMYAVPLYLTLVCLPMFALMDLNEGIARANSWMGLALLPDYVIRPLVLLAGIAAAYALGAPADASTAVLATIAATWTAALFQLIGLSKPLSGQTGTAKPRYDFSLWMAVSLPILLVEGFNLVLAHTDVIVLNAFVGPSDSGIYYAALKTTLLTSFIYYAVSVAFAHRFAEFSGNRDREGLKKVLDEAVRWTFWPTLAAVCLILTLGWPLLWLFGTAFTVAYPVMFILSAGLLVRAAVGPVEYLLSMVGKERTCAGILGTAALANIVLNLILIPGLGMYGAALSTTASVILSAALLHRAARHLVR